MQVKVRRQTVQRHNYLLYDYAETGGSCRLAVDYTVFFLFASMPLVGCGSCQAQQPIKKQA